LAFGKLDSMSSKLVAKAIVLSSLCATGIVAQTTLANAGPLAGLPCKKALGAVVRGDDACVKIGAAYVWRRLANVNDPVTAAAPPSAATQPPAPQPAAAAVTTSVVAPKPAAPRLLPDPCGLVDQALLSELNKSIEKEEKAAGWDEPQLLAGTNTADLRSCGFKAYFLIRASGQAVLSVSKPGVAPPRPGLKDSQYSAIENGWFMYSDSVFSRHTIFAERNALRLTLYIDYFTANVTITSLNLQKAIFANALAKV
jgi:hypothetical protein